MRRYNPAAPRFTPERAAELARSGVEDAVTLAYDLRVDDPSRVWATLAHLARMDPHRLMALTVAGLAMIDVEQPVGDLLAWTDRFGGVA